MALKTTAIRLSELVEPGKHSYQGKRALAKRAPGEQVADIPRGAFDPTNITGKRGGRPKGAKNRKDKDLKVLLAPLDKEGVAAILRIIRNKFSNPDHVLKAVALGWAYRHGKPREFKEVTGEGGGPVSVSHLHAHAVVAVGGNENTYTNALRELRGEKRSKSPKRLSAPLETIDAEITPVKEKVSK